MKHIGKKVAIAAAVLILASGVVAALELTNTTHFFHKTQDNLGIPGAINYGPPTQTEKNDSESHKGTPASTPTNETPAPNTSTAKRNVVVRITTYGQQDGTLSVNGLVSGVVEDGGTCTLSLVAVSNGKQVTTTRTAVADASDTSCGASSVPVSKLSSGDWQATLSYSSSTSEGKSSTTTIEVK